MRKLKLHLDGLKVESFATDEGMRGTGTVRGHLSLVCTANANGGTCGGGNTCNGMYTCDGEVTCNYRTCGACGSNDCGTESGVIIDTVCS